MPREKQRPEVPAHGPPGGLPWFQDRGVQPRTHRHQSEGGNAHWTATRSRRVRYPHGLADTWLDHVCEQRAYIVNARPAPALCTD